MCFGLVVDHVDQVDDDEQVYAWNGEVVVLDGESARAHLDGWMDGSIPISAAANTKKKKSLKGGGGGGGDDDDRQQCLSYAPLSAPSLPPRPAYHPPPQRESESVSRSVARSEIEWMDGRDYFPHLSHIRLTPRRRRR